MPDVEQPLYADRMWIEEYVLDRFQNRLEPRTLVEWTLVLPFDMELPPSTVLFESREHDGSAFVFNTTGVESTYESGILSTDSTDELVLRTRATLFYVTEADIHRDAREDTDVYFAFFNEVARHLIDRLNEYLAMYMMVRNDERARAITLAGLEHSWSIPRIVPLSDWSQEIKVGFIHHEEPLLPMRPVADHELLERWTELLARPLRGAEEVMRAQEILLPAPRLLRHGAYAEVVIFAQSATEVLLRTVHRAIEPGYQPSFKVLVTESLPGLLGGDWTIDDGDAVVADWWQSGYLMRNRVVHEGHPPDRSEASAALNTTYRLWEWFGSLLKMNENKLGGLYPALKAREWLHWWVE